MPALFDIVGTLPAGRRETARPTLVSWAVFVRKQPDRL